MFRDFDTKNRTARGAADLSSETAVSHMRWLDASEINLASQRCSIFCDLSQPACTSSDPTIIFTSQSVAEHSCCSRRHYNAMDFIHTLKTLSDVTAS